MVVFTVLTIKIKFYKVKKIIGIAMLQVQKLELQEVGTSQGR